MSPADGQEAVPSLSITGYRIVLIRVPAWGRLLSCLATFRSCYGQVVDRRRKTLIMPSLLSSRKETSL